MPTVITNTSGKPVTLPLNPAALIPPGQKVIYASQEPAVVIAALGGDKLVGEMGLDVAFIDAGKVAGNQGVCPVDVKFPPIDKEFIKKGRAKVAEKVNADTGDLQAIEFGQDMERKSIAFYLDGAGKAPDQGSKDLFMRLKGEEDKHLALLTDLYDYMVNPDLWSVRDQRSHFDS